MNDPKEFEQRYQTGNTSRKLVNVRKQQGQRARSACSIFSKRIYRTHRSVLYSLTAGHFRSNQPKPPQAWICLMRKRLLKQF